MNKIKAVRNNNLLFFYVSPNFTLSFTLQFSNSLQDDVKIGVSHCVCVCSQQNMLTFNSCNCA
jgi:hypothetical protein